jgi:hypothetical protein
MIRDSKNSGVDNPQKAGEKKCRKKNFFDKAFALYFAVLTAGNIPLRRSKDFTKQGRNTNPRSLVNN